MCGLRIVIQRVKTFVNKIMENSNNRNMSQKYTFNRISSCADRILIIMLMCVVLGFAKCSIDDNAEKYRVSLKTHLWLFFREPDEF